MHVKKSLTIVVFATAAALAQSTGPVNDKEAAALLKSNEAEQKAYINSAFDQGLPQASVSTVTILVRERSATLAPVLGARVQQALKSASPIDCFTDKTVEPQSTIMTAASAIAYAADANALKELAKILTIDDRKFGWLVGYALSDGGSRNFFPVAYSGYEIGSAPLEAKMTLWIEKQLEADDASGEPQVKVWWAETLLERTRHTPTAADWANDPIVKKIKPELEKSVRDNVLRLAAEELQRRAEH
jgi:hypothetical protein